jgi:hypothetical protein
LIEILKSLPSDALVRDVAELTAAHVIRVGGRGIAKATLVAQASACVFQDRSHRLKPVPPSSKPAASLGV